MKSFFNLTVWQRIIIVIVMALVFVYSVVALVVIVRNRAAADSLPDNLKQFHSSTIVEAIPPEPVMQVEITPSKAYRSK